jgi:hypothetical protein
MAHRHHPSTEATAAAVREVAAHHGRTVTVEQPVADAAGGPSSVSGPGPVDGTEETLLRLGGSPVVEVRCGGHAGVHVTVDGITFHDLPRVRVPVFLGAVFSGTAFVKSRVFPPGQWLVVPLPGDEAYNERIDLPELTPWLTHVARFSP